MKELRTEIEIGAPPDRVWQALIDFDKYPEWNPFLTRAEGKAAVGVQVKIVFKFGARDTTLKCRIVTLEPNRELLWTWHILFPALYGGEHRFAIEPLAENRARFVQREVFNGLLLPLFAKGIDSSTRQGFEAMDQALKARAEGAS